MLVGINDGKIYCLMVSGNQIIVHWTYAVKIVDTSTRGEVHDEPGGRMVIDLVLKNPGELNSLLRCSASDIKILKTERYL
jgi:hypothetical protein